MTRFNAVTAGLLALEARWQPSPSLSPGALVRSWLAPSLFKGVAPESQAQALVDWVKQEEEQALLRGRSPRSRLVRNETPRAGDVFCLYLQSLQRYVHTGLVLYAEDGAFRTIEGVQGSGEVVTKRRSLGPSVLFIRYGE